MKWFLLLILGWGALQHPPLIAPYECVWGWFWNSIPRYSLFFKFNKITFHREVVKLCFIFFYKQLFLFEVVKVKKNIFLELFGKYFLLSSLLIFSQVIMLPLPSWALCFLRFSHHKKKKNFLNLIATSFTLQTSKTSL